MRLLFLGDIVGEPGRKLVTKTLPAVRQRWGIDVVLANAENASGGSGMTQRCYQQLKNAGVDGFTMGDHVYRQREVLQLFQNNAPVCRPANYPPEAPGPDHVVLQTSGGPLALISLQGRLFMKPADCPMHAIDRVLKQLPSNTRLIVVDVHAEATSEKQMLGRYLDGRVAAVVGTHTHVPTADAGLLPQRTAYITDLGMTGPYDSVIGRRHDNVIAANYSFEPVFFEVAKNDVRLSGALIDLDPTTGLATAIELFHYREADLEDLANVPGPNVR